jgi:hypothetical protein
MNKTLKKVSLLLSLFVIHYSFPTSVMAVCPICTVAVAGGLGLSRYFGIDDTITGLWVGGLIISSSFWLVDWFSKKFNKPQSTIYYLLSTILFSFLTFPPLFWTNVIGHPFNTILGIDKLVFGSIIGAFMFLFGVFTDKKVRQIKGHQLFIYQKVVFPVFLLTITSVLLYFFGGYLYQLKF